MKVNFSKLKVETSIEVFEELDLSKALANSLFKSCENLDEDIIVRKIYHSTGEIELSEQECNSIRNLLQKSGIVYAVKKAVESALSKDK